MRTHRWALMSHSRLPQRSHATSYFERFSMATPQEDPQDRRSYKSPLLSEEPSARTPPQHQARGRLPQLYEDICEDASAPSTRTPPPPLRGHLRGRLRAKREDASPNSTRTSARTPLPSARTPAMPLRVHHKDASAKRKERTSKPNQANPNP